jgi:23S rRNA (adenine2503-C2)-methyltransferase
MDVTKSRISRRSDEFMIHRANCSLLGLDRGELAAFVENEGEPPFRAQQLLDAVYRQRLATLEAISTLPRQFRSRMAQKGVCVGLPAVNMQFVSQDGTVRYLIGFADGQSVETVWMPEGDGGEAGDGTEAGDSTLQHGSRGPFPGHSTRGEFDRATICVSSQVGCAVDCQFCLTAQLGVKRNLSAGEIVGQVLAVLNAQKVELPQDRINLVFMGMGEPFLNYENFIKAVRLLVEEVGLPESRMTVSTAGIVSRIHDSAKVGDLAECFE